MTRVSHGPRYALSLAIVLLAAILLAAYEQSTPTASLTATSPVAGTEKVFVVFDGPWAFVPDPKDANGILAIAPKTTRHHDLYVKASNQATLAAGVYHLSIPAHTGSAAATPDPDIAQAAITSASLQRALDSKSARYVIRLPKPEDYTIASRARSRIGPKYPPDPSTEKEYATAVSLRYNVASLNGFSLSGAPDSGTFNPLPLRIETPTLRFILEVAQEDDPADKCNLHSRESFQDLTTLLALTLYVDYPDNPPDCHGRDPQSKRPAKTAGITLLQRLAAVFAGSSNHHGGGILATAVFFFGKPTADCLSPNLILTPTP